MSKTAFDQATLDQLAVIFDHEQEAINFTESADGKGWLQKTFLRNRVDSECLELQAQFDPGAGFIIALVNYLSENKLIKTTPVVDDDTELSFMDRLEGMIV
jgi:hypothetical protein